MVAIMCDGLCNAPSCYCSSETPDLNQPDYSGGGEEGATGADYLQMASENSATGGLFNLGKLIRVSSFALRIDTSHMRDTVRAGLALLRKTPNGLQVI